MVANNLPIYTDTPKVSWGTITTANTATDGTGTVVTAFTAGIDGARVDNITFRPLGTNVVTVARIFVNNGSTNATPANNSLIGEITLAAVTGSNTASVTGYVWVPDGGNAIYLPNGYKLNITIGTTVASGFAVTAFGGDY